MAKKTLRPWRTLTIFFLSVGLLYVLAAVGGTWKPRLGLDLEGGTRITLVAEGQPSATKMAQATSIIDSRVNSTGVTEAEVSTQGGTNVVVEIPGKSVADMEESVKRTAQLRFRLVADCPQLTGGPCVADGSDKPASPSASPSVSGSAKADPSANPTSKSSSKDSVKSQATATPKPRVAPAFDEKPISAPMATTPATPAPSPSGAAQPTPAVPQGQAPPTTGPATGPATGPGANVNKPMDWIKDPGTDWQTKFALAKCNKDGVALVPTDSKQPTKLTPAVDDPAQPLISCGDNGEKALLSKAVIEGTELKSASHGQPEQSTKWAVNLRFKGPASKVFADISQKMVDGSGTKWAGGQFAIVLDGKLLSYPGFTQPILDGRAQITGDFTQAEAQSLANSLKFGALPVKFNPDTTTQTIGPSLAGSQLSAGIWAGIVGLAIVMLYCLLYYRGLGLVVIASLFMAGIITYAVVLVLAQAAGFTLTLPGIAGLIVGVGITADSFIVLFERIRDEMRDGKSMRVAVEAGWVRARATCLAADAVSFLAALVLYIFAIGVVRGFAFALGVSTIIDVIVFFFFTKPMMTWLATFKFFNSGHKYSGLSEETLGVDGESGYAMGRV